MLKYFLKMHLDWSGWVYWRKYMETCQWNFYVLEYKYCVYNNMNLGSKSAFHHLKEEIAWFYCYWSLLFRYEVPNHIYYTEPGRHQWYLLSSVYCLDTRPGTSSCWLITNLKVTRHKLFMHCNLFCVCLYFYYFKGILI